MRVMNTVDKIYRDGFPVQVPVEIKNIHLAWNLPIIADRGTDPDIEHPVEDFLLDNNFYGVHAYGG